ncbi:MAG: nucleoside triphosphate pyrophosphohydrolase [Halioglobus sp.]
MKDLLRVMQRLRDPDSGCPWDIRQDFASIVPSTLEECYELAAAIEEGDFAQVADELGDVLFQVIFYAQLGREQGLFTFPDIVDTLVRKLLRRHPHVFANGEIEGMVAESVTVADVKHSWERIKADERISRDAVGILADVPVALPALPRAQKLQKRAARVKFDWRGRAQVMEKLDEELAELRRAIADDDTAAIDDEMGDLLFTCVNLARHLQLDAESSFRRASRKFEKRFAKMEELALAEGTPLGQLDEKGLAIYWNIAKSLE